MSVHTYQYDNYRPAYPQGMPNHVPAVVHKQYNSPLPLYSTENAAEALATQTEALTNGSVGVNFHAIGTPVLKRSEVYRMVQEEERQQTTRTQVNKAPSPEPTYQSQSFIRIQRTLDEEGRPISPDTPTPPYDARKGAPATPLSGSGPAPPQSVTERQPPSYQQQHQSSPYNPTQHHYQPQPQQRGVYQQQHQAPYQQQQQQQVYPSQYQQPKPQYQQQQPPPQQQYQQQPQHRRPVVQQPVARELPIQQQQYQPKAATPPTRPQPPQQESEEEEEEEEEEYEEEEEEEEQPRQQQQRHVSSRPVQVRQQPLPQQQQQPQPLGVARRYQPQQQSSVPISTGPHQRSDPYKYQASGTGYQAPPGDSSPPSGRRKPVWPPPPLNPALQTSTQSIHWIGSKASKKFVWPPPKAYTSYEYDEAQRNRDNGEPTLSKMEAQQRADNFIVGTGRGVPRSHPRAPARLAAQAWEPYLGQGPEGRLPLHSRNPRRTRRFEEVINQSNATRLPPTYRPPPGTQHITLDYEFDSAEEEEED